MIDRYVEGTPADGWPRWMLDQIEPADYILIVCTQTYYLRFRGQEAPGVGKGVDWEGAIITNELYDQKSISRRFVPILFDSKDRAYIPEPLRGFTHYLLTNGRDYTDLTDYLANVAGIQPGNWGRHRSALARPSRHSSSPRQMAPTAVRRIQFRDVSQRSSEAFRRSLCVRDQRSPA